MMNAEAARRMTESALSPGAEIVQEYLRHVETKVISAAAEGKRQISHPLSGLPPGNRYPDPTVMDAVRKALEANGYTWTHHPNPDPGHPGSSEYETVSW